MNEITKEDIEWWEEFLSLQVGKRSSGYYSFIDHIVQLARAVKELQENKK